MDLKLILKTFSNLRRMTSDEVAFLETLRAMNESEREALVETLSPQPVRKSSAKKSASKKSPRASSLEQQIQKRGRREPTADETLDDLTGGFEPCTVCEAAPDANIHHLQTIADYHPFQSAAPTASDLSSVNGGASGGIASSETGADDVSSAVHAGG